VTNLTSSQERLGWSKKGDVLTMQSGVNLSESYSVTVVTSFVGESLYVSIPRSSSNSSIDFLLFVIELLDNRTLAAGDIFILDNASIHYADNISDILDTTF